MPAISWPVARVTTSASSRVTSTSRPLTSPMPRQTSRAIATAPSTAPLSPFDSLSTIAPTSVVVDGMLRSMPPVPMMKA